MSFQSKKNIPLKISSGMELLMEKLIFDPRRDNISVYYTPRQHNGYITGKEKLGKTFWLNFAGKKASCCTQVCL